MAKTLIALLFATLPFVVDATSQLVIASASCSNGLTLDGIHSDCGGECVFGGKVDLSGLVTVNEQLPKYVDTKLQYQVFGKGVKTLKEVEDVKICSAGVLSAPAGDDADYSCPEAGQYNFHINGQKILGSIESWYSKYFWYNFSLLLTIYDAGSYDRSEFSQCTLTIHTKKSSEYVDGQYVAGAAVVGASILGLLGVMRRRRSRTQAQMEESGESMQSNFEMMRDPSATIV